MTKLDITQERLKAYHLLQRLWNSDAHADLLSLVSAFREQRELPAYCNELACQLEDAGIIISKFIKFERRGFWPYVKRRHDYTDPEFMRFVFPRDEKTKKIIFNEDSWMQKAHPGYKS